MGKRYFCDYCERSFADGAENRKKHLASVNHQKVRKAHYDMFKDAATILEENKLKRPCRKFQNNGDCEFGNNCKYSHLTPAIIQQLEEEARAEKSRPRHATSNIEAEIDAWIESKACKLKEDKSASSTVSNSTLPAVLANIPNLPPSLVPCTILDAYHAQRKNDQEWG